MQPFLAVSSLCWIGLGLWAFVTPESLLGAAGVAAGTRSGVVELRAMYGGLPTAVGVMAAAALVRPREFRRPALLVLAYLCGGLFVARLLGALLAREMTPFLASALLFEILSTVFAVHLLRVSGRVA